MEQLKRYSGAAIAAALACVSLIIGILAMTVWKPAQQIQAAVTPTYPYVVTRDGLFQLEGGNVTVSAEAPGHQVTLAVGTPSDVLGWIGDSAYTEIVGIAANRTDLKTEEHEASTPTPSASPSATPAADAAASPTPTPATDPAGNDMWVQEVSASGNASMELSQIPSGRSMVIAADGAPLVKVTVTWQTPRANALAVTAMILAVILAVVAAIAGFLRWQVDQKRAARAAALEERAQADLTTTAQFDPSELAAYEESLADSAEDTPAADEAADDAREEERADDEAADDVLSVENETSDEETLAADELDSDNADDAQPSEDVDESAESSESPVDVDFEAENESDEQTQDTLEDADSEADPADEDECDAHSVSSPQDDEPVGAEEEAAPVRGRHGIASDNPDQDPPERVPTDTGIIDLSSVRPGAVLPTRRALREAREKGERHLVVDGHEFDTGLIPQVKPSAPQQEDAPAEETSAGSWTSLVGTWLSPKRKGKR